MKGRSTNTQRSNCGYAKGGAVSKFPVGAPKLGAGQAKIKSAPFGADGKPAKRSLARPGRKIGGRVNRAEGGRISEDSKREAVRLRKEATEDRDEGPKEVLKGFPGVIGGAIVQGLSRGRVGKTIGTGIGGASALGGIGAGGAKMYGSFGKDKEAGRIERGEAEPGKEDRKHGGRAYAKGGRVKKAEGGWIGEGDSGRALKEKSADSKKDSLSKTRSMADWLIPTAMGAAGTIMPGRLGLMRPASAAVSLGSLSQASKRAGEAGIAKDKAKALSEEGDKAEGKRWGGSAKRKSRDGDED